MVLFVGKVFLSALLISFVSWLSGKKIGIAGFLTALPLTSLLALAYSQFEWKNSEQTIEYAKSILWAIPISLLFFIPFLLAKKFQLHFWTCYVMGVSFLFLGYNLHKLLLTK